MLNYQGYLAQKIGIIQNREKLDFIITIVTNHEQ